MNCRHGHVRVYHQWSSLQKLHYFNTKCNPDVNPNLTVAPDFFFVAALHFFGSTSPTNRYGERFRGGQYSLVSFLFAVLVLMVPPCPAICKSGGHVLPIPYGAGATKTQTLLLLAIFTNKNSPTFPDEIAGNMSNKCAFINPNSPLTSRMKNELQYK